MLKAKRSVRRKDLLKLTDFAKAKMRERTMAMLREKRMEMRMDSRWVKLMD